MRYRALDKLIMVPLVSKVAATSGTADKIVVDEMGARNPHQARTKVITILR